MRNSGEEKLNEWKKIKRDVRGLVQSLPLIGRYAEEIRMFKAQHPADFRREVFDRSQLKILLMSAIGVGFLWITLPRAFAVMFYDLRAFIFVISSPFLLYFTLFGARAYYYKLMYLYSLGEKTTGRVISANRAEYHRGRTVAGTFLLEVEFSDMQGESHQGIARSTDHHVLKKLSDMPASEDELVVYYDEQCPKHFLYERQSQLKQFCLSKERTGALMQADEEFVRGKHRRVIFFSLLLAFAIPLSVVVALVIAFLTT